MAITSVPVMKRLNVVPSLVPFVFFIIENLNFLFGRTMHANTTYSQTARQLAKSRTRWQVFYFQEFPDLNNPYLKIKVAVINYFFFVICSVLRPASFLGIISGYFRPKIPFFLRASFKSPVIYLKL